MKDKTTKALLLGAVICLLANLGFAQTQLWASRWDGGYNQIDQAYAITTDASGNVYVTGKGATNSGLPNDFNIVTVKYNASGVKQWERIYNESGGYSTENDCGYAIAIAATGDIYVAGTITRNYIPQEDDIVLIKYNSAGTFQWAAPYSWVGGFNSIDVARSMAIRNIQHGTEIFIAGSIWVSSQGATDGIILKCNASGIYSTPPFIFNGTANSMDNAHEIKVDAANNAVYVAGTINNSGTYADGYVKKIDATLWTSIWSMTYNNSAYNLNDGLVALTFDASGNIYAAGSTNTGGCYSCNRLDGLLIKYNSAGTFQWEKSYNNPTYNRRDEFKAIAYDGSANIYVTGYSFANLNDSSISFIDNNYLTVKYSASTGNQLWTPASFYNGARPVPENNSTDVAYSIAVSPNTGKIYVTGRSDEGNATTQNVNITTLRYSTTGTQEWSASYDYTGDAATDILPDETYGKYSLTLKYDACHAKDYVCVTGGSQTASTNYDYVTLTYGYTGSCEGPEGGRFMDEVIEQKQETTSIGLFPNPFSDIAILKLSEDTEVNNATLKVYDVSGSLVSYITGINSPTIIIERRDLTNGIYFYKLADNNVILTIGKFIITD